MVGRSRRGVRWGDRADLLSPVELPDHWHQVPEPTPLDGSVDSPAGRDYAKRWRTIRAACDRVGWGPLELAAYGIEGLDRARRQIGEPGWALRTRSHYQNVVRYAGLGGDPYALEPSVDVIDERAATALMQPVTGPDGTVDPAAVRTAAVAALSWAVPALTATWVTLTIDKVRAGGSRLVVHADPDTEPVTVDYEPAVRAWKTWETVRARRSRTALSTVASSRTSRPGDPLSERAFQVAWRTHSALAGLDVTFDRFRLSALAAGARHPGGRGAVLDDRRRAR